MKKIVTGASLLLAGALLAVAVFAGAGSLGPIGGWDSSGPLWTAVSENNLTGVWIAAILLMLAGIAVMAWGNRSGLDK